jgi:uncharacterized protein YcbK (DUF882 family)
MSKENILTRRCFVKKTLYLAAGIVLASPLESIAMLTKQPMSFYHNHTGERLEINYSGLGCTSSTLKKLNYFLRDFRTGDVHPIDPALLNILYGIQQKSGSNGVIEIISGYRSPATNNKLRSKNGGVARQSLHMKGRALDIRLTDLKARELCDVAISLQRGGVGFYPKSNFVHIDTGRFRTW